MGKYRKIIEIAYVVIYLGVLFFVFGCLLSISTNYIEDAKNEGTTILPMLSMTPSVSAWLLIFGIIVTVVAISKSLPGTYFGVTEGATEVAKTSSCQVGMKKSRVFDRALSIILVSAITSIICCTNSNAISMIYAMNDPLIAMILLVIPVLSTYLIPALKPYRSVGNPATLIVGLLCVSVMFFGQNVLFSGSFQ